MWDLGGLRPGELLKRTARESWEDGVFGYAARLAFYHFIAIFPALLVLLMPLVRLESTGAHMRDMLVGSFRLFLPQQAAELVTGAIRDIEPNARAGGWLLALAVGSALWAGHNASWAMVVGLNTAYETAEDRSWWRLLKITGGLGLALLALVFFALLGAQFAGSLIQRTALPQTAASLAEWITIAVVVMITFAVFYRFGPNLDRPQWQWSTPGAAFGTALWIASTLLVRLYFNRFSNYHHVYGRAAAAATVLVWLYMTSATVLLGAELNSEIEKAREQRGQAQPERHQRERQK